MRKVFANLSSFAKSFFLLLLVQLFFVPSCYAENTDALTSALTDGLPVMDYPRSLRETAQFEGMDMTPEALIQAAINDHENLCHTLETYGVDASYTATLTSGAYQRFAFFDVMITNEPCDITVLCFRNGESCLALLFSRHQNTSRMIDVMYDAESVKLLGGLTTSWLQFSGSAFATSLSYEWLYNLSSGITETGYISSTSFAAPDVGDNSMLVVRGNAAIDEHSTIENGQPVLHCYLTVVQHLSLCSLTETSLTEMNAATRISIYQYDYNLKRFVYLKTNQYDGINAATTDFLLRPDLLLLDMTVDQK